MSSPFFQRLLGGGKHTWSGTREIWEIHATSNPGQAERLHEVPKSDGFQTMYGGKLQSIPQDIIIVGQDENINKSFAI